MQPESSRDNMFFYGAADLNISMSSKPNIEALEDLIIKQVDEFGGEWSWGKLRHAHKELIDSLANVGAPPYKESLWDKYRDKLQPGFDAAIQHGSLQRIPGQASDTPEDEVRYRKA